jgi:hypothetical protein
MNPPTLPTDNRTFVEKIRETHAQTMNMGPTGPLVTFCVFVSSLSMNLYNGLRYLAVQCERLIRRS